MGRESDEKAEGGKTGRFGVVQRVDLCPHATRVGEARTGIVGLAVLRLRIPGKSQVLLVQAEPRSIGVALERPTIDGGALSVDEKLRWRKRLVGAHVEEVFAGGVRLAKGGEHYVVAPEGQGGKARVVLRNAGDDEGLGDALDDETLRARGAEMVVGGDALEARARELRRRFAAATKRVERRIAAIRGDLARCAEADALAARALPFVAAAASAPRGSRELRAVDWTSGEAVEVSFSLDGKRPPREQLEATFRKAKRLRLGASVAQRRLADAERAKDELSALSDELAEAADRAAIADLEERAGHRLGRDLARSPQRGAARGGESRSPPHRVFRGAGDARIFVGRGAARNDELTFHGARPHDLWLHAKGEKGAHVIVPLDRGKSCPAEVLVDAALLAAHFSDARGEGTVEVEHTERRHLRKPRGSPPGFVVVTREKILVLRVDGARLGELLAREEHGASSGNS